MFARIGIGAAILLAAALLAHLGHTLIQAYGDARYQSGLADGRLKQLPDILAANAEAARAGLAARDRVITADGLRDTAVDRMIPQILSAQEKVAHYAASVAGRAACLAADRVRGIEDDRVSLFPASAPGPAGGGPTGPMPADAVPDTGGS